MLGDARFKVEESQMIGRLKKSLNYEQSQGLIEYALLILFLALAAIALLPILGKGINNIFSRPETVYF